MAIRVPRALVERDPAVIAPAAGLVHVRDDTPGITRRRAGSGFTYRDASDATVTGGERERVQALAIPPAWTDVWICPDPAGYLQASGFDDAGRKQYRYHDVFRQFCDQRKFERLRYFARAIIVVRKAVADALAEPSGTRGHAVAAAVQLIDTCLLRVGNHESAANGHYGATTLTIEHVVEPKDESDHGFITLDYIAKSGKTRTVVIEDDDLADVLIELAHNADNELFWFRDQPDGKLRRATASDINRFVVEHAGDAFSAKDFRTWGGSRAALVARADGAPVLDAVDAAAEELGNTRAVARSSYVHPLVSSSDDAVIERCWQSSRSSKWMDRGDRALAKLLAE